MKLTINSSYIPKHHRHTDLCDGHGMSL